jgi:hypothetical protein
LKHSARVAKASVLYCKVDTFVEKKRRPDQKLPTKVWEKIEKDISEKFYNGGDISDRRRQLRNNLTAFLKNLNTGTADGEGDSKPELQSSDIIPLLKSSDVYASHRMAEKRFETITDVHATPTKKRKAEDLTSPGSESVPDLDMTRKASRSRCTAAIEKIAEEVASSNVFQEKFFKEQSERHAFKQSRNATISAIDEQEVIRRSKLSIKAELDLLVFKKDHGLISAAEFRDEANRLLAKSN